MLGIQIFTCRKVKLDPHLSLYNKINSNGNKRTKSKTQNIETTTVEHGGNTSKHRHRQGPSKSYIIA
jgi:hypothetical protein